MASLRILSAGSTMHGLKACASQAAQATGVAVGIASDHGDAILEAVLQDETEADAVILPADMIDKLTAAGLARDRIALGAVGIGVVVRAGAAVPPLATMEQLRAALLGADVVLLTRAPSGDHLMTAITALGLTEAIAPKLVRFDTAAALCADLAARAGDALGFAPETEIRAAAGVTYAGDVPADIQVALPYAAALLSRNAQPDAGRAVLAFLKTAPAREAFARSGMRLAALD